MLGLISAVLFAGCVEPLTSEGASGDNNPPIINSLISDKLVIRVGETAKLTVDATDAEGDALTYSWFALLGDIIGNGSTVRYSASYCCAGINDITVTVKDSRGASASKTITLYVNP
ncbi:MAG: hypothetical protein KKH32_02895 [Bacteroidetes bacterium]|nr:hypothetical protein [Bacteroidota bacterium]